jgi:hypothetical protein
MRRHWAWWYTRGPTYALLLAAGCGGAAPGLQLKSPRGELGDVEIPHCAIYQDRRLHLLVVPNCPTDAPLTLTVRPWESLQPEVTDSYPISLPSNKATPLASSELIGAEWNTIKRVHATVATHCGPVAVAGSFRCEWPKVAP